MQIGIDILILIIGAFIISGIVGYVYYRRGYDYVEPMILALLCTCGMVGVYTIMYNVLESLSMCGY